MLHASYSRSTARVRVWQVDRQLHLRIRDEWCMLLHHGSTPRQINSIKREVAKVNRERWEVCLQSRLPTFSWTALNGHTR